MGNGESDPSKPRGLRVNEHPYRTLGNGLILTGITALGIATSRLEPIDQTFDDYSGRVHDLQQQRPDIAEMRETVYELDKSVSEDPVVSKVLNEQNRQKLIFLGAAFSSALGVAAGLVARDIRKR